MSSLQIILVSIGGLVSLFFLFSFLLPSVKILEWHIVINRPAKDAFRILLLDLSLLFSEEHEHMLHHQIEEPLGLLYLMSYLDATFKHRIQGKIFKSRKRQK